MNSQRPVLVTGAGGLLGSRVAELLVKSGKRPVGTYHNHHPEIEGVTWIPIDFSDGDSIRRGVVKANPSSVVHCAAFTEVDKSEDMRDLATKVNALGTKHLATTCKNRSIPLVYVSTDYVFDGSNPPYSEDSPANPLGHYAKSKWEGEMAVRSILPEEHIIGRVSVVFGLPWYSQRQNFFSWLLSELRAGRAVKIVSDQWNNPTLAEDGARSLVGLLEKDARGTYHCTGRDCISRYEFARRICSKFGLPEKLIAQAQTSDLSQKALRPPKSCLSVRKIEQFLGRPQMSIDQALAFLHDQEQVLKKD